MFDVSFAEVLVVVTAAGVLLGRRDIISGSRVVGTAFGRIVGTLHGMRTKFEQQSKGTELHQLHSSVRHGLNDMRTIGYDLMTVSPFNQSPMSYPGTSSAAVGNVITPPTNTAVDGTATTTPNISMHHQSTLTNINRMGTEGYAAIPTSSATTTTPSSPDVIRLARLILAEEELNIRLGTYPTADPRSATNVEVEGGADIIQSVVKESIINEAFNKPKI